MQVVITSGEGNPLDRALPVGGVLEASIVPLKGSLSDVGITVGHARLVQQHLSGHALIGLADGSDSEVGTVAELIRSVRVNIRPNNRSRVTLLIRHACTVLPCQQLHNVVISAGAVVSAITTEFDKNIRLKKLRQKE